jgi:simple sugar transport system permease protein
MLGGLIYSFLTITLRANQNVNGLTLTIFGGGVANLFGGTLNKMAGGVGQISVAITSGAFERRFRHSRPWRDWKDILLLWIYGISGIILAFLVSWVLKTKPALDSISVRVGENRQRRMRRASA